jgi:type II secretory pathway pseudopilin PulG
MMVRNWKGDGWACANRRGFTMIEAAMSVGIVGVLLACSMTVMGSIARQRMLQAERRAAFELDEQLLGEVLSQYFQDPAGSSFGPSAGQPRATFNSVDEYNGYTESPPALRSGATLSDYTGWTRSVAVAYADPTTPGNTLSSSTLKRVTVTVTAPSGKQYSLTGLRSQYGVNEYLPQPQTNLLTSMSVSLQSGGVTNNIYSGGRPLNITTSQQ